ncbi:MAG: hypothetical protein ABI114_10800 [Rhodanobacter sp.]
MKNPRPVCPNITCVNHLTPATGFFRKKGYRRPKHNHQPIPRYQCKTCGSYFCATQTKAIKGQHRPDLNKKVFEMAVSGVTMRRMATLLGCSPRTIDRKVKHLVGEAKRCHAIRLASIQSSYVMMDELETFVHSKYKQLSVPVVVRVKTGEVLGFGVARKPCNKPYYATKYSWTLDERSVVTMAVFTSIAPSLKANASIVTDAKPAYITWVNTALPSAKHVPYVPVKGPGYDPLFAINVAFAKMRNDLARLGRKTWTTTKTIPALENHLWLWVAWTNKYELK